MAKKKTRSTDVTHEQNDRIAYSVIELDPVRDKIARLLLALLGLRHVLFISAKDPIQHVEVNSSQEPAPKPKKKAAKKKAS